MPRHRTRSGQDCQQGSVVLDRQLLVPYVRMLLFPGSSCIMTLVQYWIFQDGVLGLLGAEP
jgi:hypothetical protein